MRSQLSEWRDDHALMGRCSVSAFQACYFAPHDRLHALPTRSKLERCAKSVAALTQHERALAARLAFAHALGGRADDDERRPCV